MEGKNKTVKRTAVPNQDSVLWDFTKSPSQCREDFLGFFLSQQHFERRGSNAMTQGHEIHSQNKSEHGNETAHVVS